MVTTDPIPCPVPDCIVEVAWEQELLEHVREDHPAMSQRVQDAERFLRWMWHHTDTFDRVTVNVTLGLGDPLMDDELVRLITESYLLSGAAL